MAEYKSGFVRLRPIIWMPRSGAKCNKGCDAFQSNVSHAYVDIEQGYRLLLTLIFIIRIRLQISASTGRRHPML